MIFRKVLAPEEAQRLNASKAHRDTHEVYFATADGIKFALEAVGEKKFKSNVKDMPVIAGHCRGRRIYAKISDGQSRK